MSMGFKNTTRQRQLSEMKERLGLHDLALNLVEFSISGSGQPFAHAVFPCGLVAYVFLCIVDKMLHSERCEFSLRSNWLGRPGVRQTSAVLLKVLQKHTGACNRVCAVQKWYL